MWQYQKNKLQATSEVVQWVKGLLYILNLVPGTYLSRWRDSPVIQLSSDLTHTVAHVPTPIVHAQ